MVIRRCSTSGSKFGTRCRPKRGARSRRARGGHRRGRWTRRWPLRATGCRRHPCLGVGGPADTTRVGSPATVLDDRSVHVAARPWPVERTVAIASGDLDGVVGEHRDERTVARAVCARAQNQVGSGDGATLSVMFASHGSRSAGAASASTASTGSRATAGGGSAGALFGPLGPEPQAAPTVKIKACSSKCRTTLLLHDHI